MKATTKFLVLVCVVVVICATSGVRADFTFGEPVNLGSTVNSAADDRLPCVSYDGLELYFASDRAGGGDLWVCTRAARGDDWDSPRNLGPLVNSPYLDWGPSISPDGLELYFQSDRPNGLGATDIWATRRATTKDAWTTAVNLGPPVNSAASEFNPCFSSDGCV